VRRLRTPQLAKETVNAIDDIAEADRKAKAYGLDVCAGG
jgi:hypothetical protein